MNRRRCAAFDDTAVSVAANAFIVPYSFVALYLKFGGLECLRHIGREGAGCVSLSAGYEVWSKTLPPGRELSGHAAFSADHSALVVSEYDRVDRNGFVSLRDPVTFAEQDRLPTFGLWPHQMKLLPGSSSVVVANKGLGPGSSGLSWVDLRQGKLIERRLIPPSVHRASHFAIDDQENIIAISDHIGPQETPGAVFFSRVGGGFMQATMPSTALALNQGQVLSVALDKTRKVACTTNPDGRLLAFWHMEDGSLIKWLNVEGTSGVALSRDGRHFWVSTRAGRLWGIDARRLEIDQSISTDLQLGDGSHLYVGTGIS